ncbi:MAG: histidine phosphatase family protein [Sphingomonadaceae bacterium]|nr:histidine phosphatase family protein [Sphingomonadaceae bacterium]
MLSTGGKRLFIARHGETVFNRIARMQGQAEVHTPLTWDGCVQAKMMGRALANYLGSDARPQLWSSSAGRALQTLALVAEEIGADWHQAQRDDRLLEIDVGSWSSRTYADIAAEIGPIVDLEHKLFSVKPDGGEWYDDVATRLSHWLDEQPFEQDMLVICHGMTARVLRGLLLGHEAMERFGAPIAPSLSQGSMVMIRDGVEELVVGGEGPGERA